MSTYSAYNLTSYPSNFDHLYTKVVDGSGNVTGYKDENNNSVALGTASAAYLTKWENKKDLVKAEHVIVLQDMLYSIQRTLGTNVHHSTYTTVDDPNNPGNSIAGSALPNVTSRLKVMEGLIPTDSHINSLINAHHHGQNGLSAVSLEPTGGQISGKLGVGNIVTDFANTNAIDGNNIYSASGVTINAALNARLPIAGGTITGNLTVNGNLTVSGTLKCKSHFEAIAADFTIGSGGQLSTRPGQNSTGTIINKYINSSGQDVLGTVEFDNLRYGRYTACVRMYFGKNGGAMPSESTDVFSLGVGSASNGSEKWVHITGKYINDATYFDGKFRTFYISFDYGNNTGDIKEPILKLTYNKANPYYIGCDSVTIVQSHTAVL